MLDGVSLKGWRETPFSGRGRVSVQDGAVVLGKGVMTGITWTGEFPKANYEVRMEAMRADGLDFFAGITSPVNDSADITAWMRAPERGAVVNIFPIAAATIGSMGEKLTDLAEFDARQFVRALFT